MDVMPTKQELLTQRIQHIDIKQHNVVALVDAMHSMAYSSRDLARAASIYEMMLRDTECGVILCLAGSLISAGLQRVIIDLVRNNMVDAIVSTGANIVDQDFFEALGFNHYIAGDEYKYGAGDADLRELMIDRIYDTFIDEEELRICDDTTHQITNSLEPRPYSSREFIREMGAYLAKNGKTPQAGGRDSIVLAAYEKNVPIFCPAFSDCSAGFGLVAHQHARQGKPHVSIDSAKDFYEITQLKIANPTTGLLMIGGGVPKNFAQDIVVAADTVDDRAIHVNRRRTNALRCHDVAAAENHGTDDSVLPAVPAPFLAGGQVIRHEVFNIARVERVQVQNPVDGKLDRFVHLERLKA